MRKGLSKRIWLVLMFLVVSMLVGCLGGGKSYLLTVQVLGVGEEPLEGASVVVGAVTKDTDADGKAVFEKVSGKVTIEVEAADYIAQSKSVTVSKDQMETILLVQDTGDVEDVMNALQDENLRLTELAEDDPAFFDQLDKALGYFADSFLTSFTVDYFFAEVEVAPLDIGQAMHTSETLSKAMLLGYEEGWTLWDYEDYLWDVLGDHARLFWPLLGFVDFSLDDYLEDLAAGVKDGLSEEESIIKIDHSELSTFPPVVVISGNLATWTQAHTINSTTTTHDEQVLTGTYSCAVEVGLVKDTEWKINEVHINLMVDETVPEDALSLF